VPIFIDRGAPLPSDSSNRNIGLPISSAPRRHAEVAVLPEVQIQESRRGSISVAIIRTAGKARSEYWAPFRDQHALAAYAISETEIIAYGEKGRLTVYDLAAARTLRECETGQSFAKCQMAPDRRWLWILSHNRVSCWETSSLLRTALFDAVELKGYVRKVLLSKDDGDFVPCMWKGEVVSAPFCRWRCRASH
jgi:hypothetical protein